MEDLLVGWRGGPRRRRGASSWLRTSEPTVPLSVCLPTRWGIGVEVRAALLTERQPHVVLRTCKRAAKQSAGGAAGGAVGEGGREGGVEPPPAAKLCAFLGTTVEPELHLKCLICSLQHLSFLLMSLPVSYSQQHTQTWGARPLSSLLLYF